MSEVIVTFKVMPTGVNVDLDALEVKIKDLVKADRINREPIAFGIVALNVIKIIPDAGGEVDAIEQKLRKLEEVSQVEVTSLTKTL